MIKFTASVDGAQGSKKITNAQSFDELIAGLNPGEGVRLLPGIYPTDVDKVRRGWCVKPGVTIEGSLSGPVRIQMGGDASKLPFGVFALYSDSNRESNTIVIRNLLVDCGWAEISRTAPIGLNGEANMKTGAVGLWGSNCLVENVRCINSYGTLANNQEQFGICVLGDTDKWGFSSGNRIVNCHVEQPQGNYGSPYMISMVRDSVVEYCSAAGYDNGFDGGWQTGGVNIGDGINIRLSRNIFRDCLGAFYHDTGNVQGLLVEDCVAIRCWGGILNNSVNDDRDYKIFNNTVDVQTRNPWGGFASAGIEFIGRPVSSLLVEENKISKNSKPGNGYWECRGIVVDANAKTQIINNKVTGSDYNNASGAYLRNNRDSNGNVVPGLEDTVEPKQATT